jgi:hypothetical protein
MIEIATLSLLVRAGDRQHATKLAQTLVERLVVNRHLAQTWMTLRYLAFLLAEPPAH